MDSAATPRNATKRIFGYITGYVATHVMQLGLELGLFAALAKHEGGADAETLAKELHLHAPYVDSWLKAAHALELLEATDTGFAAAPFIDVMLGNKESMFDLGPLVNLYTRQTHTDAQLMLELYRSGGVHTYQEKGEAFSAMVAEATRNIGRLSIAEAVGQIPGLESRLRTGGAILDMGCGSGQVVISHAEAYPTCCVLGVDIDEYGIEAAKQNIEAAGVTDRAKAELMHGAEIAHENEFDLVTMVLVLHETEMRHRDEILDNCYRALKPGGVLLVCDENYPNRLEDAHRPKHQFVVLGQWLVSTWGNVFPTADEQKAYLERHGFRDVTQAESQAGLLLTWGTKPGA